jgi:transposase
MAHATVGFTLDTLLRKKIEKLRRKEKDVRIHHRLSALLWLGRGRSFEEIAELLGISPRTVRNWLELYRRGGLEALRALDYQGDPG